MIRPNTYTSLIERNRRVRTLEAEATMWGLSRAALSMLSRNRSSDDYEDAVRRLIAKLKEEQKS